MTQSQDRRATSGVGFHNTGSGCSPCFRGWVCRSGGPTLTGRPAKFHGDVPCNKWGRSAWNSASRGLTWHWKRGADTKSSKVLGPFHYRKKTIQKAWFDNRFLCWEQLRSGVPMARYQRRKLWPPSVHASHSVGPFLEEPIQHLFFWTRSVGLNNCSWTFASWETRTPRPSALFFSATPSRYLRNQRNMFFPSSLYLSLVFPFYSCFFFLRCQACKVQCRVTFKCLRYGKPIHLLVILIFGVSIFKHAVGRCTPTGIALRSRTTCRKHNGWKTFSLPWSACLVVSGYIYRFAYHVSATLWAPWWQCCNNNTRISKADGEQVAAALPVMLMMLPTGFCFEPGQMANPFEGTPCLCAVWAFQRDDECLQGAVTTNREDTIFETSLDTASGVCWVKIQSCHSNVCRESYLRHSTCDILRQHSWLEASRTQNHDIPWPPQVTQ